MTTLVVSHLFPNEIDPISGVFVREQVRFLKKRCEIRVISPVPWLPPIGIFGRWKAFNKIRYRRRVDGVEVFHPRYLLFPRRILFCTVWFSYLLALLKIGGKANIDIIHAHCAYPDGLAAVLFGRIVRKPVVITTHGSDVKIYPKEHRIWKILTVLALSEADRIIAVSSELKREIRALGVAQDKIRVIFNGVDTDLFRPLPEPVLSRQEGSPRVKRIVYVGRVTRQKGVVTLLQAMVKLGAYSKELELVIVGVNREGKEDKEIIAIASDLGLGTRVRFVDLVPSVEVPLWLAGSDVFVLPSFSEGLPLSLIEALACGKPVVSTTCGGPEDIVTEETGILVSPGDVEALASAIAYVLDHPQKYDPERISSYARDNFSLKAMSAKIAALYSEVEK